jgi:hydrogenase/urease accessory protein HupE
VKVIGADDIAAMAAVGIALIVLFRKQRWL